MKTIEYKEGMYVTYTATGEILVVTGLAETSNPQTVLVTSLQPGNELWMAKKYLVPFAVQPEDVVLGEDNTSFIVKSIIYSEPDYRIKLYQYSGGGYGSYTLAVLDTFMKEIENIL